MCRKYDQKKVENPTGDKLNDMIKDVKRTTLELENEIIRREKEQKIQNDECDKLQAKIRDLQVGNQSFYSFRKQLKQGSMETTKKMRYVNLKKSLKENNANCRICKSLSENSKLKL